MEQIYIFKYPQPGQEDGIFNPSTGSAREEDMAIAMSRFSFNIMAAQCFVPQPYRYPAGARAREITCGALLRHVPSPEIGAGRAQENEPRKLESVIPSVSSVNTRVVTPGIGGFYVKSIIFLSIHCTLSSVSSRFPK